MERDSGEKLSDSGNKEEIRVRTMEPGDLGAVFAVNQQSPQSADWTEEVFRNQVSGERGWVAEDGGEIAGFVVVRILGDEGEVLNMAVAGTARRKGVGTGLLARALREITEAGARTCFLEVRESNEIAKAFYKRMGFEATGKRPRYYQGPEEAALCMEKKLTDQDHVPT